MLKTTMRKRIALTVVTALTTGVLSVVATAPVANAHGGVVSTASTVNNVAPTGTVNQSLFVAEKLSTSGAAVTAFGQDLTAPTLARSLGLLAKDTSSGVAQTATTTTGAQLALYAPVTATTVAFTGGGGTFSVSSGQTSQGGTLAFNQTRSTLVITPASATTVATAWVAPSTAGTYTISMYYHGNGAVPTTSIPAGTLGASIVVTVVASSVAKIYSPANSFCAISNSAPSGSQANNTDGTPATANGGSMWINFALKDAYNANMDAGNLVATATNGALLAFGDNGANPVTGTASTIVAFDNGWRFN